MRCSFIRLEMFGTVRKRSFNSRLQPCGCSGRRYLQTTTMLPVQIPLSKVRHRHIPLGMGGLWGCCYSRDYGMLPSIDYESLCVWDTAMRLISCRYHRLLLPQVCISSLIPVLRIYWMILQMRDIVAPCVQRCASRDREYERYAGTRAIKFYIGLQIREN